MFSLFCTSRVIFLWLICLSLSQARQIRISRYNTQIVEDTDNTEVQAKVWELKKAPYPAAGYRPGRSFPLPGEEVTESDLNLSTTTEYADVTSTTLDYETTESTTLYNEVAAELAQPQARQLKEKAPYAPAGYRPSKAFNLPTEVKAEENLQKNAPYPAAGYQPSIPFTLPNEAEQSLKPLSLIANNSMKNATNPDVSTHPACGVSTNPLHPVPAPGAKQDPDAETVVVEAPVGSTVIKAEIPINLLQYQSQPLVAAAAPLILRPGGWIYTEELPNWQR